MSEQIEVKSSSGHVEMVITHERGQVVQHFKEPMQTVRYDPHNAKAVACAITDAAFEADTGMKPAGESIKAALIERHHDILVPRLALMLGSLRDKKTLSNGALAEQVVSTVFNEVFK